jgi:sugar phosphate isomerase/epimerase
MKLSVITDEISQDFEHALDVMREYDVRYAELRGLWNSNIADLDVDQVNRAKTAMAARGISVCALSTPFYKCDLDVDAGAIRGRMHLAQARGRSEQIDMLRRCAGLAHSFDCNLVRVFTFWRKGDLTPDVEDQIVDAFAEPVDVARQEGVILGLENEHACYIGTGAEASRIISKVDSPSLRSVWDPGNALLAGETPFPDGYEAVEPFLAHVHVKDATPSETAGHFDWCVIGDGAIDYEGQFNALRRRSYTGYISLETHYIPQGGTPEEGSRACLAALRRFIKD